MLLCNSLLGFHRQSQHLLHAWCLQPRMSKVIGMLSIQADGSCPSSSVSKSNLSHNVFCLLFPDGRAWCNSHGGIVNCMTDKMICSTHTMSCHSSSLNVVNYVNCTQIQHSNIFNMKCCSNANGTVLSLPKADETIAN
jgi:hypothetical protein